MQEGDLMKYVPTATVGKVQEVTEKGGVVWVKLDRTGLLYDSRSLVPADPSEYIEVSFKERDVSYERAMQAIDDLRRETEEVNIDEFMPSGGG